MWKLGIKKLTGNDRNTELIFEQTFFDKPDRDSLLAFLKSAGGVFEDWKFGDLTLMNIEDSGDGKVWTTIKKVTKQEVEELR